MDQTFNLTENAEITSTL